MRCPRRPNANAIERDLVTTVRIPARNASRYINSTMIARCVYLTHHQGPSSFSHYNRCVYALCLSKCFTVGRYPLVPSVISSFPISSLRVTPHLQIIIHIPLTSVHFSSRFLFPTWLPHTSSLPYRCVCRPSSSVSLASFCRRVLRCISSHLSRRPYGAK